ncbi:MAG: hypothetical protein ABIK09_09010 [Pseudomonadota bacterium]
MRSRTVHLLFCLCVSIGQIRCDAQPRGTDAPAGSDSDTAPEVVDAATTVDRSPPEPCADLPDLTGRVYRVTDFVATAPTDGINPTWKKWAEVYDLVMLFRILEHDRAAGRIEAMVACGGAEVSMGRDGVPRPERLYYGLPPTPISFALVGCDLTFTVPLDIHLFTPWVSGEIPIQEVTGYGVLAEDGAVLERLDLSGFLSEATAAAICIDIAGLGVVNLHWFFNLAGICPDTDTDGDDVLDAYNFLGWVRAVDETALFDDAVTPIVSLVPECVPHEDPCVVPSGD